MKQNSLINIKMELVMVVDEKGIIINLMNQNNLFLKLLPLTELEPTNPDSINRSVRPPSANCLPMICKKTQAMWNTPILTTS